MGKGAKEGDIEKNDKVELQLVKGRKHPLTLSLVLNFLYIFLPRVFITIPIHLIWHYILNRRNSPLVQVIGRRWYSDFTVQLVRYVLARGTVSQSRIIFDRFNSYKLTLLSEPAFKGKRDWVSYVKVNGTAGRWIAKPGTKREEDEVVFYYVHGGGFVLDTGARGMPWLMEVAQEMNGRRNVQFSVFCLDYRLASEQIYPSQLIETLAGYHYLVNTLGISEDKICMGGDSAGGNLVAALLLHLVRPNPRVKVPSTLGPSPKRPASVLLVSPFVKLISNLPSRKSNEIFDYIESNSATTAVYEYIGADHPPDGKIYAPSWNPKTFFWVPIPAPPLQLVESLAPAKVGVFEVENKGKGLELLKSPYVNPSVCTDLDWWKEALPGEGRTMVAWGGKEIFCDDIEEFMVTLRDAGIEPAPLKKELGCHDWMLFDHHITGVFHTKTNGDDKDYKWAVLSIADFFQDVDRRRRRKVDCALG
ncbi:alpha/beta-hydrolase [Meredithblackwellia eburnea MCA 4105]